MNNKRITVVSGLPRSGTSMMMKMLAAGGMKILADNIRVADKDNPQGYYELEKVKQLEHEQDWLKNARGKAVKVISELLQYLPSRHAYKIVFMRRKIDEILASQKKMLIRRGESTNTVSDEKMAKMFFVHLQNVDSWLKCQSNMEVLYINYNAILMNPVEKIQEICSFTDNGLDAQKMTSVIDKTLYRQRK